MSEIRKISDKILKWKIEGGKFKDEKDYKEKKKKGKECPKCGGTGQIEINKKKPTDLSIMQICPTCNGDGFIKKGKPMKI